MPAVTKDSIEAIAMDTWDPSIKAVNECCPWACIVFDQFHMVKAFGRVIDQVRRQEYQKATSDVKAGCKLTHFSRFEIDPSPHFLTW